jgi:hypothetical protein
MRTNSVATAVAAIMGLASAPASAELIDPIGSAILVVNQVTAAYSTETRTLKTGDGVRQNELIEVAQTAKSEIRLNDDTKLALGPGSRLLLDRFVYDPNKTGNAIVLNMIRGTFRFITGTARKPSYVIRTPSAAITVRGTIFDTYVMESGESWVLLQEGGVSVCNTKGECGTLDEPGKMIPVTAKGEIGKPVRWSDLGGIDSSIFDRAFPFVREAPSIDPNPAFTREALLAPIGYTPEKAANQTEPGDSKDEDVRKKPRRIPKLTTIDPPRKRRVVEIVDQEDDEDVVKPERPVRVVLPGRGIKIRKPKDEEKTETDDSKGENGGKLLRAALGAAAIAGSLGTKRKVHYPKHPSGDVIGSRIPGRSSLGDSILK